MCMHDCSFISSKGHYFISFVHLRKTVMLQVNVSIITEADQVQKEIIELTNIHGSRNLVIGAVPEK